MTVPGYPDYQRVSLSSGVLLGTFTGNVPSNTQVFKGYVGNWQSLNTYFQNSNKTSTAYFYVEYTYWTDATFTSVVATVLETRSTISANLSQHNPLSPWLIVNIVYLSGTALGQITWSMYGSPQVFNPVRLWNMHTPLYAVTQSYNASQVRTIQLGFSAPGAAALLIQGTQGGEVVTAQYYDAGLAAFNVFAKAACNAAFRPQMFDCSVPDAPIQLSIVNSPAGVSTIDVALTSYL